METLEDLIGRVSIRFVFLLTSDRLKRLIGSGFEYESRHIADPEEGWSSLVTVPPTISVLGERFTRDLNGYRLQSRGTVQYLLESLETIKSLSTEHGTDIEKSIAVVIFTINRQYFEVTPSIDFSKIPIRFKKLGNVLKTTPTLRGIKFGIDSLSDREEFWASLEIMSEKPEIYRLSLTVTKSTIDELISFLRSFPQVVQSIIADISGE